MITAEIDYTKIEEMMMEHFDKQSLLKEVDKMIQKNLDETEDNLFNALDETKAEIVEFTENSLRQESENLKKDIENQWNKMMEELKSNNDRLELEKKEVSLINYNI